MVQKVSNVHRACFTLTQSLYVIGLRYVDMHLTKENAPQLTVSRYLCLVN